MGGSLPRGRRAQCALGLDPHGGRPSPVHPDRPAPGLRLRHRARGHRPPRLDTLAALMRVPVLSIITWAPFIGAVLIMFLARHRPLLVRWLALLSTGTSFVLSLGIYWAFDRSPADAQFFQFYEELPLYLLFGSAFILVGILALYVAAGSSTFSFLEMEGIQFDRGLQSWVFLAFYVGFGILAGIWPLHTWSPDGHASAPTAVSMLHAGVLMKLGAYGVVRLGLGLLPDGTTQWVWLVGAIACVNIVYGALSAMAQTDLKYVIAYSSVSHMGVVMLGMATLTESGLNGSIFQMFAHGIMTGLFFALVGLVYEKAHSRAIFSMGGFGQMMPGIATAFTIAGLSSLGLPATAGFVAEFLTFLGAWQSPFSWWLFPGVIGAFLTSVYVLRVAKQIFWGPQSADPHFQHLPDAQGPEWAALIILVFTLVLFGVAPGIAIGPVDTATVPLLIRLGVLP